MENVHPWTGQPSDRGWLKNRTERIRNFLYAVQSMSPPTHDVTQEEKALADVSRLRSEVMKCLQQIKNAHLHNLHTGIACYARKFYIEGYRM